MVDGTKVQLLPETLIPAPSTLKTNPSAPTPSPKPSTLHPTPNNVRLRIRTVNMGGVDPVKSDIAVTVFRQGPHRGTVGTEYYTVGPDKEMISRTVPSTLNPKPYTLHPNPTPQTLTLNAEPYTINPKPSP